MKFLEAIVVVSLATLFYNVVGFKLNREVNSDRIVRSTGWNNLGLNRALRSVFRSNNAQFRATAASGGSAGEARWASGNVPRDGDTDLLQQWCENSDTLETDLIRWLTCSLLSGTPDDKSKSGANTISTENRGSDNGTSTAAFEAETGANDGTDDNGASEACPDQGSDSGNTESVPNDDDEITTEQNLARIIR